MIILKLYGGLGNQMFMYAFARMLQEQFAECIDISTYELRNNKFSKTPRAYALHHLQLNPNVRVQGRVLSMVYEHMLELKKTLFDRKNAYANINNGKIFDRAVAEGLYASVESYKFYRMQPTGKKFKFIDGYFMSWKYHTQMRDVLRREFTVTTMPSLENRKKIKEIRDTNAVCVHIRLGDFLSCAFKRHNYICKESYYLQAMRIIAQKVDNPRFYIFSTGLEDIAWIKKNYRFEFPVSYIELDNPDYEELRLMIQCKHFIISNSSFSWWAQYLCENDDKIVVAPSEWNRHNHQDTSDIYMPEWEIVTV